jgi:hypothetical protein
MKIGIKEWPMVMTCSLRYLPSTREVLAIRPFYSLGQLKTAEVVEIEEIPSESFTTSGGARSNLLCTSGVRSGQRGACDELSTIF